MAPKAGQSHAQKLEKILEYFRRSKTCHTLKDLEGVLPTVANVHKMVVKDLIKDLTDESKVKVEKIGSGNWYWCFAGEEMEEKQKVLEQLQEEKARLDEANAQSDETVTRLKSQRALVDGDKAHQDLLQLLGPLEEEFNGLTAEKEQLESAASGGMERLNAETEAFKSAAMQDTDNIYVLESYLDKMMGGDSQMLDALRRECYGSLYREGEGLPDLDAL